MDKKHGILQVLGWILLVLAFFIGLGVAVTSHLLTRPKYYAHQVQESVTKVEKNLKDLADNNADASSYGNNGFGLFIFNGDSLLFWNNNSVGPRIIRRRVKPDTDTICNLLTGDYYVHSFSKGQMTYYTFALLNTTYKLENRYFENRFVISNPLIKNKVQFHDDEGYTIYSTEGRTLGRFQIEPTTTLRSPHREIVYGIIVLLALFGILLIVNGKRKPMEVQYKFRVEYGIGTIIAVAVLLTYLFYHRSVNQENAEMRAIADRLSEKRDVRFEKSYTGFTELVNTDNTLNDIVFSESNVLADVVLGYCKELLFDETMNQYVSSLTLCDPDEEITIQPGGFITDCDDYFLEKLANNSQKRIGEGLYFIDYNTLDPNYLGKIRLFSTDSLQEKTLYLEFYKPIAPEGFSFPQFLQETGNKKPYDYSVAHYRDNILVYKYGKYAYPNYFSKLKVKDMSFSQERGYKHYTRNTDNNKSIVISTPRKGWSEITAPFAVFFLGLLIPYLVLYWLVKPQQEIKKRSFRQRLQSVVFLTLGLSFLAIGPVSVIYMRSLYNQKTSAAQFETTRSIAAEMCNDVHIEELINQVSRETIREVLQHYATTFFTDLNLYKLDGRLIATTRMEIYDLNLQAPLMNPEAYQAMHQNKALFYTHEEHLGKGLYESAYIPLNDSNGNTIAYLNTPYFTSATELHKEIRNFVLTYINIILVLLAFALIFVINLTNRLTQPLSLIQSKLGNIKIDQKNEPIEWKANDEIGALVKQYNQLIVELEKSTVELKRTTTESAWRGVARQVAHEIKNSLTPMRLSVQMLQRNIDNGKATPEQILRTTNTLIEQIDALSDIASSFSRYAKLPENHPQPLDLAELIGNVVNLYDNTENIEFHFNYDPSQEYTFNGDKTNLNSAFGNLVKNAVQAIGSKPDGKISADLKTIDKWFIISIKDNGKGIKEEDKSQIFLPNFTTKTGGSGVGLSLTYNIVQVAGGTISFESEENVGTTFRIELPKQYTSAPTAMKKPSNFSTKESLRSALK